MSYPHYPVIDRSTSKKDERSLCPVSFRSYDSNQRMGIHYAVNRMKFALCGIINWKFGEYCKVFFFENKISLPIQRDSHIVMFTLEWLYQPRAAIGATVWSVPGTCTRVVALLIPFLTYYRVNRTLSYYFIIYSYVASIGSTNYDKYTCFNYSRELLTRRKKRKRR